MAFTWNEDINQGSRIESEDLNEIKNNLDHLADEIGISPYSWANLPVSSGQPVKGDEPKELRDATDYTHDNMHSNYNSTDDSDYSEDNATVNSTNLSDNSGYNSGY
ncbi:MAG: hypothetical protein MUP58_02990 [Candidatus Nanohaloarchaeota archaeon QJJ-9]|nr:hypothetical protein [Candidatus Nanohaloarchaeota archaeon QJJ-9]